MSKDPANGAPIGIAALPATAARQLGSGQVLVDPSSVVKELIDNALDARAKSIFIDITSNTIESIQVKDDGHGVPSEDRPLLCRRHCTSKIRDFHDLKVVGAKWLGFRGEALSSISEMSGSLFITTRVEGEPVAVRLKYGQDGELASTQRDSHPVGTTVKASNFFEHIPVRKQTAIKNSATCLSRIRRLIQAYALARPAVRFRLHVLKSKNTKVDFMYAPRAIATVEDATLKVIGKGCGLQCELITFELNDYKLQALLPKATANGTKLANEGAFISIDSRPMSSNRGTIKQITTIVRETLRKLNHTMLEIKDPFFCIDIKCPTDSYDPNIEPAKDSVMFDNEGLVLSIIEKLLSTYYMNATFEPDDMTIPESAQRAPIDATRDIQRPSTVNDNECNEITESSPADPPTTEPRWRSSMYGIDEDDLDFLQPDQAPGIEEDDGIRVADVSNPWTIARMNTTIKPRKSATDGPLLSPAKTDDAQIDTSSPPPVGTPFRPFSTQPLTPQSTAKMNMAVSSLHPPIISSPGELARFSAINAAGNTENGNKGNDIMPWSGRCNMAARSQKYVGSFKTPMPRHDTEGQQRQPQAASKEADEEHHTAWFGRSTGVSKFSQIPRRKTKQKMQQEVPLFPTRETFQSVVTPHTTRYVGDRLFSENNTDIRDFFRRDRQSREADPPEVVSLIGEDFPDLQRMIRHRNGLLDASQEFIECERAFSAPLSIDAESTPPFGSQNSLSTRYLRDTEHVLFGNTPFRPNDSNELRSINKFRSISVASEQPLVPFQGAYVFDSRPTTQPRRQKSSKTQEMEAFFNMPHDKSVASRYQYISHQSPSRRSIARSQRTHSSQLPLDHTLQGHYTHNIILSIAIGVATIIQSAQKLDMRSNGVDWSLPIQNAPCSLIEPIREICIVEWVIKLDRNLHGKYTRIPGVDTCSLLHEAIQRGLDATERDMAPNVSVGECQGSETVTNENCMERITNDDISRGSDVNNNEFDDQAGKVGVEVKVVSEFDEGIRDDMLLDM